MKRLYLKVYESVENKRIDKFVSEYIQDLSRSGFGKLFESGNILVNGKKVQKSYKIKINDHIEVVIPEKVEYDVIPEDIPLDIVYEDDDILVVNKKKGMIVHPAGGNYRGTLVNALLYHCKGRLSGINGVERPGIVHRIDKDTSGLLVVAKTNTAHLSLAQQMKEHTIKRIYHAVVYGKLIGNGTINLPIGRSSLDRKKMCVRYNNSKEAITNYKLIEEQDKFSHIELVLETGRTHQIRVHMSYIGYPIAGDIVYGPKKVIKELNGQCLHAKMLGFIHPSKKSYINFNSELPEYFSKFLKMVHK